MSFDLTTELALFLAEFIQGGGMIIAGNGSPEGVVAGNVGWLYTRLDSTGSLYTKTSGTGTTGWSAAGGGGTPGGADTQVQFNSSGSFGASADLTWNASTFRLLAGDHSTAFMTMGKFSATQAGLWAAASPDASNYILAAAVDGSGIYFYGARMLMNTTSVQIDTGIYLTAGPVRPTSLQAAVSNDTVLVQGYDQDAATFRTFATLVSANVPSLTISQPSGGILAMIPPSADPHVVGALWNNAGTLTISAG